MNTVFRQKPDDVLPRRLKLGIRSLLLVVAGLAVGFVMLCTAMTPYDSNDPRRRHTCPNSLKQIGLALSAYHQRYHSFPPAYVADADGKPMHSWRVLLLPFFDDPALKAIHEQYDFSEPWDGPNNRKLGDLWVKAYVCPSDTTEAPTTSYLAVIGPLTMWPNAEAVRRNQITDPSENTAMLTETADSGIIWSEPRDLTFDDLQRGFDSRDRERAILSPHAGGVNFLYSDGSVWFIKYETPASALRAMWTIAGGEQVDKRDH